MFVDGQVLENLQAPLDTTGSACIHHTMACRQASQHLIKHASIGQLHRPNDVMFAIAK